MLRREYRSFKKKATDDNGDSMKKNFGASAITVLFVTSGVYFVYKGIVDFKEDSLRK